MWVLEKGSLLHDIIYNGETRWICKGIIQPLQSVYNSLGMQSCGERGRRVIVEMEELVVKISRLNKRLISYGYSQDQVGHIIMEEFLKLKKVEWSALKYTTRFHQLKSSYRIDSATAEIMLMIEISVPDLHSPDVSEYLLNILEYNSLTFGIRLSESSSDSNDSNSVLGRRELNQHKRRNNLRRLIPRKKQKRKPTALTQQRPKKRVHVTEQKMEKQESGLLKRDQEFDHIFMQRPKLLGSQFTFEQNLEKQLKKEVRSSDSQG